MTEDQQIERRIADEKRNAHIEQQLETIAKQVETLEKSVGDLVEAWNTAGNIVKFVKYLAAFAVSLVALIGVVKNGIHL